MNVYGISLLEGRAFFTAAGVEHEVLADGNVFRVSRAYPEAFEIGAPEISARLGAELDDELRANPDFVVIGREDCPPLEELERVLPFDAEDVATLVGHRCFVMGSAGLVTLVTTALRHGGSVYDDFYFLGLVRPRLFGYVSHHESVWASRLGASTG